nr:FAD-binding and (Fe-S)-binding domain-containing protein [Frondihabitans australicus]
MSSRPSDRLALAHDASHYLVTPQVVVTPRTAAEVGAVVAAARARGAGVTFRSGGTSLSGQAQAPGVLIDTRRHFRGIEPLGPDAARVRVEPGATVRQVNARLAGARRRLGPDPASEAACTLGGVIANNSSGMTCGTTANTYATLDTIVVVLADGTVVDTSLPDADARLRAARPDVHDGLLALRGRVMQEPTLVASVARHHSLKNTMGYGLNALTDFASPAEMLAHLVVGSEGTLAFVASAVLRTLPVRAHLATAMLYFSSLRDATDALPVLVDSGAAAIELLDATSLRVAQRDAGADASLRDLAVDGHAALLVEYQETTAAGLRSRLEVASGLLTALPLAQPAAFTTDAAARAALWHIRKDLYATVAGARPSGTTALLEDVAVPVASLADVCERLVGLFAEHGYDDAVIFGHAKDGNIHFMLTEHFDDQASLARYDAFTEEMVALVLAAGGTLKAEHGTGRIMAPYVRLQYGDELYEVMLGVKRLLDPEGVLNPGVVLPAGDVWPGAGATADVDAAERHGAHRAATVPLKTSPPIEVEADSCVECGYCEPVCPSKDLTRTPRQRIVLRRERARALAAGDTALVAELDADYDYDGLDTCAADGMCQTACPVLIDTGKLVKRLRATQTTPLERAAWAGAAKHWGAATRAGSAALTAAAHLPAPLVTGASQLARGLLGDDTVPLWARDLPAGGGVRHGQTSRDPAAVFFPACIQTLFGPAADGPGASGALQALCDRAGVALRVPQGIGAFCCSTPWKSKGMGAGSETMAATVLPALWESSDHGRLPVVCDAASCTEGLEGLVAAAAAYPGLRVVDAVTFVDEVVLPRLRSAGLVPVPAPLGRLALHPTCSSTRLGSNDALLRVAGVAAREVVVPDDWGCCAFAGDRGMLHPELTASATAREAAGVVAAALDGGAFDAYASCNRTCELGMTRATGHPYEHVLEVLLRALPPR